MGWLGVWAFSSLLGSSLWLAHGVWASAASERRGKELSDGLEEKVSSPSCYVLLNEAISRDAALMFLSVNLSFVLVVVHYYLLPDL